MINEKFYKKRAEKLAQPIHNNELVDKPFEVIEFLLGNERYALESLLIREVYPLKELTVLPCVPNFIYGVINVRRKIISVIDLRALFELPIRIPLHKPRIIILGNRDKEFGILAEEIIGLNAICLKELQLSFPTLTSHKQEFLKGITKDRLIVLDAERLLGSDSLIIQD